MREGCKGCVRSAILSTSCHLFPRLLTHEHVARFLEEMWRSEFPVLNSNIYIYFKQGGGVAILEETSGGRRSITPLHSLLLHKREGNGLVHGLGNGSTPIFLLNFVV